MPFKSFGIKKIRTHTGSLWPPRHYHLTQVYIRGKRKSRIGRLLATTPPRASKLQISSIALFEAKKWPQANIKKLSKNIKKEKSYARKSVKRK